MATGIKNKSTNSLFFNEHSARTFMQRHDVIVIVDVLLRTPDSQLLMRADSQQQINIQIGDFTAPIIGNSILDSTYSNGQFSAMLHIINANFAGLPFQLPYRRFASFP